MLDASSGRERVVGGSFSHFVNSPVSLYVVPIAEALLNGFGGFGGGDLFELGALPGVLSIAALFIADIEVSRYPLDVVVV